MTDLTVQTEAVETFAATNAAVSGDIAAASGWDQAANVVAMTPVFGLIGADYLAMFAAAQVLQAKDINDLSVKYDKLSQAAFSTARTFTETDHGNAADLAGQAAQIGEAL